MIVKPRNPHELIPMLKAKQLVLYGMGSAGSRIGQWCDDNKIEYVFADQDAHRKQCGTDKIVVTPETLKKDYPDANIVITSILYYDQIVRKLLCLGIHQKYILSYKLFMPESIMWKDLEHTTTWGEHSGRMKMISEWVPADARSVADYGEGKLSLKKFLNKNATYYPIDYTKRSDETIICDFNDGTFPNIRTDISVCTATLVFITTGTSLIRHICENTSRAVILSYVTRDVFSNIDGRRASGYVNDFSEADIIEVFSAYGYSLKEKRPDPANRIDTLYLFCKN